MARVKVKLADNIARVVFIESDATKGATVGVDLMLNGRVATPAALSQWLNSGSGSGGQSTLLHSTLAGLQQGDDHPQYTMWQAAERITGQWVFERQVRVDPGTAALPSVGFINDVDTGVYSPAVGVVGVSANGTETFRFGSGGQLGVRGDFGTQDQALLSQGPGDSPEWTTLAPVALSNDYDDLDNKPTIPPDLSALDFTTFTDETTALPNSRRLVAGANVTFNTATPGQLVINASGGGGGGGQVDIILPGAGIDVDDYDPAAPMVSLDSTTLASLSLADTALQPGDYDAITLITQSDETSTFPASRRLVAGSNVTFSTSTPGQLVINASGGGGGGGQVDSIGAGTGISVNSSNPVIPVVAVNTGANFTWTGGHDFTTGLTSLGPITVSQTSGNFMVLERSNATATQRRWRHEVSTAGNYTISTESDAGAVGQAAILLSRTGTAVNAILLLNNGAETLRTTASNQLLVGTTGADATNVRFQVGSGTANDRAVIRGAGSIQLGLRSGSNNAVWLGATTGGAFGLFNSAGQHLLAVEPDGRLFGVSLHNNANSVAGTTNQYIASGTYTPTITAGTNLSSISLVNAQWIRVGNVVSVSGGFRGNISGLFFNGTVSLPIATGTSTALSSLAGVMTVYSTGDRFTAGIRRPLGGAGSAHFEGSTSGASAPGSTDLVFHFSYVVV